MTLAILLSRKDRGEKGVEVKRRGGHFIGNIPFLEKVLLGSGQYAASKGGGKKETILMAWEE